MKTGYIDIEVEMRLNGGCFTRGTKSGAFNIHYELSALENFEMVLEIIRKEIRKATRINIHPRTYDDKSFDDIRDFGDFGLWITTDTEYTTKGTRKQILTYRYTEESNNGAKGIETKKMLWEMKLLWMIERIHKIVSDRQKEMDRESIVDDSQTHPEYFYQVNE